jgi:hypothetical protein
MKTFLIASLLTLSLISTASGQVVPGLGEGGGIVSMDVGPGMKYQYDFKGNSANLYQMPLGNTAYTRRDSDGNIVGQGYIFNAMPHSHLEVEPLVPSPRYSPREAPDSIRHPDLR